jgi:hypothetical protein
MNGLRNLLLTIIVSLLVLYGVGCISRSDGEKAQDVLSRYFSLLDQKEYAAAAELYGGEYSVLEEWNPSVDPNEQAKLMEMGCTINGLQCLPIKGVGAREDSAPDTFEFYVRFENPDGSVFVLESPDATTNGSRFESDFKFTVLKRGDDFFVQDLPVFVP